MSMRMASFLAGFGGGYLKADRQTKEDARQAKLDARQATMDKIVTDRADRETADYNKQKTFEAGLADAGKPIEAEQPNDVLKDDEGGNDMPAVPAFRAGKQRYATMAEAQGAANKESTPEAMSARQAAFMNANGKPLEAIQMSNAVMDSKLKKLNLTAAEVTAATEAKNNIFMDLSKTYGAGPAAARMISDTKIPGFDGVNAVHEVSPDGKTQIISVTGQDGQKKVLFSEPVGQVGDLQIIQSMLTMKPETTVQWFRDANKQKKDQDNLDRTFNQNQDNADRAAKLAQEVANNTDKYHMGLLAAAKVRKNNSGAVPSGNVSMDAIDKQLAPLFTKEDPTTGAKALDTNALMSVRLLATRMPAAASGDATGAALQAHTVYSGALKNAGGDHAKAMQIIQQATSPPAAQAQQSAGVPNQAATKTPSTSAQKPQVSMVDQAYANSLAQLKSNAGSYGQFFMGPNDFKKIANDEKLPKWQRDTAIRYLEELDQNTQSSTTPGY